MRVSWLTCWSALQLLGGRCVDVIRDLVEPKTVGLMIGDCCSHIGRKPAAMCTARLQYVVIAQQSLVSG